ncbi:Protein of unknown function DUF1127 [Rhodospirillum rubrum ATCC 11170]|uniref:YjiS-like domain-containing protein n=3 Tax=Rhodospirillum rubrum TaxID=1085 RepID=Q2RS79_RHORT|nr:DUF1127 domain-containing protein [Rhodospirillum rubrum]ABC23016.1 Protein of unknown function DUF1127 [Rhodospirillum rubrum ATCC 11170]MBK5954639.1 hypothetical protein [Rhodospirillum rubrum]QXG79000.1 DUF1127 domain-containing protein [Rhodospirillum rubrum]
MTPPMGCIATPCAPSVASTGSPLSPGYEAPLSAPSHARDKMPRGWLRSGITRLLIGLIDRAWDRAEYKRQKRQLAALDDRALADIGLSRAEADPFFDYPSQGGGDLDPLRQSNFFR